jgi:ABC-type multidrug transport system, permease component
MNGFITIIKMNLKLLLRNKGYLAFLILLPVFSVIMLNLNNTETMFSQQNTNTIYKLSSEKEQIMNMSNDKINLKVIDCSDSKLSNYILKEMTKTGSFQIYRYKEEAIKLSKVRELALYSANHSSIAAVLYIPADFEQVILNKQKSNMVVFEATKDPRISLLKNDLNMFLKSVYGYAELTGYQTDKLEGILDASVKNEMKKNIVSIEVGDTLNLNSQQKSNSSSMSYSLSFLTIAFLFCGVFIAATVVEERKNRVYNRFLLSTASLMNYAGAKLLLVLLSALMQTGIIGIAIKLLVRRDFGIPFTSYLLFVFCLGIIFNLLSVVIGVLTNNVLTSNYIAFLTWTISCLLAGLYFPLDGASKWWAKVSMLMPQRWVVKSAEMLMAGKTGVYSTFLMVVTGYLIVILSIGLLGIKVRRKE